MQLCKLLGIVDRDVLKRILTHRAYVEWMELWQCDPWGEDRGDLRSGIAASAALAPWTKKGKSPKPLDFMPYAKAKPKGGAQQSTADMKATWAGIQKMISARQKPKDNADGC